MSSTAPAADVASVVVRLQADVAALLALDLTQVDGVSGPALHRSLATAAGQVQAVAARVLARVEADGRWADSGWRTFGEWAARRQGASVAAVRRDSALGHALDDDLPGTRLALHAGAVSLEHAQVLARYAPTSPARRAALASARPELNEAHLVAQASRQGVDEFGRTVRRWASAVDAAAAEAEGEVAAAKEYLTVTRRPDGVALQGFLTHEHGEAVATALRAVAGVPAATDARSREERQAAALVDAARLVLDRGLAGGGQSVRPHLTVLVPWETLLGEVQRAATQDGDDAETWLPAGWRTDVTAPAETLGGTLLTRSVLDRLACDSEISRVVFGPSGDVLDVGRMQRTYTGQQRRAVIARDRSCRYPGCGAPVMLGGVHHVVSWAHGGRTSVHNGVLLCWFHHDLVHRRGLRISRDGPEGRWVFVRGDGVRIDDVQSAPHAQDRPSGAAPPRDDGAECPAPGSTHRRVAPTPAQGMLSMSA